MAYIPNSSEQRKKRAYIYRYINTYIHTFIHTYIPQRVSWKLRVQGDGDKTVLGRRVPPRLETLCVYFNSAQGPPVWLGVACSPLFVCIIQLHSSQDDTARRECCGKVCGQFHFFFTSPAAGTCRQVFWSGGASGEKGFPTNLEGLGKMGVVFPGRCQPDTCWSWLRGRFSVPATRRFKQRMKQGILAKSHFPGHLSLAGGDAWLVTSDIPGSLCGLMGARYTYWGGRSGLLLGVILSSLGQGWGVEWRAVAFLFSLWLKKGVQKAQQRFLEFGT